MRKSRGDNRDDPSLIAHRGFAGDHPENTLSAFRAAATVADWIELDCRPTGDDDPAVFHDPRLDRCTDRSGRIAETASDVVFETEVFGTEPIPTLAAALEAIPTDTGIVLDLKGRNGAVPTGADERWDWLAEPLAAVASAPHPTLVSTFWEDALAAVEEHAPGLPTAYLFTSGIDRALTVADGYGCAAIHPPIGPILDTSSGVSNAASELPVRAHEASLAVNVWTVTSREEAAASAAAGVDGLIADHMDVLAPESKPNSKSKSESESGSKSEEREQGQDWN